jgi:hypothetical protein
MPSGQHQLTIQFWNFADAPADVKDLVRDVCTGDWIALVPMDLNNERFLRRLSGGEEPSKVMRVFRRPDGSAVLVGEFAPKRTGAKKRRQPDGPAMDRIKSSTNKSPRPVIEER